MQLNSLIRSEIEISNFLLADTDFHVKQISLKLRKYNYITSINFLIVFLNNFLRVWKVQHSKQNRL